MKKVSVIKVKVSDFDTKSMKKVKRTMIKRLRKMKHTGKTIEQAYKSFPINFVNDNW